MVLILKDGTGVCPTHPDSEFGESTIALDIERHTCRNGLSGLDMKRAFSTVGPRIFVKYIDLSERPNDMIPSRQTR